MVFNTFYILCKNRNKNFKSMLYNYVEVCGTKIEGYNIYVFNLYKVTSIRARLKCLYLCLNKYPTVSMNFISFLLKKSQRFHSSHLQVITKGLLSPEDECSGNTVIFLIKKE